MENIMGNSISNDDLLDTIKTIEHPEISKTLVELGMILDVAVRENNANVAMARPMLGIPEAVRDMLVESIRNPIENLGLQMNVEFFEMTQEVKDNFFVTARANWKGSI